MYFKVYFKWGWNKSPLISVKQVTFDIGYKYIILTILITEDDHNHIFF